jgi:hypothetical protein
MRGKWGGSSRSANRLPARGIFAAHRRNSSISSSDSSRGSTSMVNSIPCTFAQIHRVCFHQRLHEPQSIAATFEAHPETLHDRNAILFINRILKSPLQSCFHPADLKPAVAIHFRAKWRRGSTCCLLTLGVVAPLLQLPQESIATRKGKSPGTTSSPLRSSGTALCGVLCYFPWFSRTICHSFDAVTSIPFAWIDWHDMKVKLTYGE